MTMRMVYIKKHGRISAGRNVVKNRGHPHLLLVELSSGLGSINRHNQFLLTLKDEIVSFGTAWMELEGVISTK